MTISRETLITTLTTHLQPDPDVIAMWLEGADATGSVDEYSDLDVCCSVRPGTMAVVTARAQAALQTLGELDLAQPVDRGPDESQTFFHLAGASPYQIVDFNVYVGKGSTFVKGDEIEKPLVLFDKEGAVKFRTVADHLRQYNPIEHLQDLEQTVSQLARVEKYLRRANFIEALAYYERWLLSPLVEALRMRYTPLHPDYSIIHISRQLPPEALLRLEDLYKVGSLEELELKLYAAAAYFDETAAWLRENLK